nr:InlB B-repeat-containing protein [Akkermansiaceae bacterium]
MKPLSMKACLAAVVATLGVASLTSVAVADTVYFDDFNDQQNVNRGGPYTQSLHTSVPTIRTGLAGGSASATWLAGVETGGWGQRDFSDNNVATPTSSNFLAFTPDPTRVYKLEASIDTTPLGGADPGGTGSWFTLGFTSSEHNWNGVDANTIAVGQLVRWNSNQVANISYVMSGADLAAAGIQFVGWITDRAGVVNLNGVANVKIDNFRLTAGVPNPTLTYDGNGSDGGAVPTDPASPYVYGNTVTVAGAGTMTRSGFNFAGWNTASDGMGTNYSPAATFVIENNTTLYARWIPVGSSLLTYDGNGSTGGSVPVDLSSPYTSGATVTVLGNTGSLTKTSYSFSGWNTAADGSGTPYNPGDSFNITADTTLYAIWTPGPDYVWNNSAATDNWNTSDLNWNGAAWSNSASNHAFFTTVGGNVFVDPGIVAGSVNVGTGSFNFPSLNLFDGDLSAASLTVQGFGSNSGAYGSNPTLTVDSAVTISGDVAVGRSNLRISGGTFTANRIISAPVSADWGRLVVSGGTVTATNGVDGSVNTGATFAIDLDGGELRTPSIRVADREIGTNNNAFLTFNGGMLTALGGDNADFITTYGGGNHAFVGFGGANIDTNGFNIGILVD